MTSIFVQIFSISWLWEDKWGRNFMTITKYSIERDEGEVYDLKIREREINWKIDKFASFMIKLLFLSLSQWLALPRPVRRPLRTGRKNVVIDQMFINSINRMKAWTLNWKKALVLVCAELQFQPVIKLAVGTHNDDKSFWKMQGNGWNINSSLQHRVINERWNENKLSLFVQQRVIKSDTCYQ